MARNTRRNRGAAVPLVQETSRSLLTVNRMIQFDLKRFPFFERSGKVLKAVIPNPLFSVRDLHLYFSRFQNAATFARANSLSYFLFLSFVLSIVRTNARNTTKSRAPLQKFD